MNGKRWWEDNERFGTVCALAFGLSVVLTVAAYQILKLLYPNGIK